MRYLLLLLVVFVLVGCAATKGISSIPPAPQQADGGLGFVRTLGLVGIGAVVFLACWNSMKIYIAAIIGIATTVCLTTVCMHYEKWFALVMFIALGTGLLAAVASLFVKHKGIFLAWRKRK